jgi:hypothetical protein
MQGVKFSREPDYVAMYSVFISSAAEMQPVRMRIEQLINESINPPLRDRARAQLLPQLWERAQAQAQAQAPDRDVNEIFVERALQSHAAMALFRRSLRPGTRAEVEALIDAGQADPSSRTVISVLRFACEEGMSRETDLDSFFEYLANEGLLWEDTGTLGSDAGWRTLVKVLVAYALAAYEDVSRRERTDVF